MYMCNRCGETFDEPEAKEYCYETYNGVGSLFQDRHYGHYSVCPICGSEDIDPFFEEDEDL